MALPNTGPISLNNVNVELGNPGTSQISMNDAAVRSLFQVPTGAISMSDGYGKANEFSFTISANTSDANLQTLATNAGWNGVSRVVATISPGIYISSTSTSSAALTVPASFPGGVELINQGTIVGRGGNAGAGGPAGTNNAPSPTGTGTPGFSNPGSAGSSGGPALSVAGPLSINNTGTIAGGGGGGGGGGASHFTLPPAEPNKGAPIGYAGPGGGGGGGRSSYASNSSGGAAGTRTKAPASPPPHVNYANAGNAGTVNAAGSGGSFYTAGGNTTPAGGTGGAGGNWGSAGSAGSAGYPRGQNPSTYFVPRAGGSGGAAGAAVSGNPYITWIATGTRLGPIS